MKEFQSTTGGRHAYNTDFKNLQELALAMQEIFRDCGSNFIISGCNVTVNNTISVSDGYAYIDGRVCKVNAANGLQASNLFIVAKQRQGDAIPYADGNVGTQYVEYYAEPVNATSVNSAYIVYNAATQSFPNLSTSFFNYYTVCKRAEGQSIDELTVNNTLTVLKQFLAPQGVNFNDTSHTLAQEDSGIALNCGDYSLLFTDTGRISVRHKGESMFSFSSADAEGTLTFDTIHIKNKLYVKEIYLDNVNIAQKMAPIGSITMWAGSVTSIPENYMLCNGDAISTSDYDELYKILGTSFNTAINSSGVAWAAPGSDKFRLPDLRGRFIVGFNPDDNDYSKISNGGGQKQVKLTANQSALPEHSHVYAVDDEAKNITDGGLDPKTYKELQSGPAGHGAGGIANTSKTKSDAAEAHENRPPFYTLAYIIRVK